MDNKTDIKDKQKSSAIKIKSIQAASLYRVSNGYKFVMRAKNDDGSITKEYKEPFLDLGNAVIGNSLFAEYVRKHGVTVKKNGGSLDFLMVKFDRGVDEDDSDKENIKSAMSPRQLRDYYYENGATVVWKTYDSKTGREIKGKEKTIAYRMLLRSPGKAKEGECLFVREELHKKIFDYLTMKLWEKMPDVRGAKIVEMSAYAPLITATALDYIKISMENIFVLKDQKSSCHKKAVTVKVKDVEHVKKVKDFSAFEEYINQHGRHQYKLPGRYERRSGETGRKRSREDILRNRHEGLSEVNDNEVKMS